MKTRILLPKVSILIVNYNNAQFLKKCINSVLKQTYVNKEIIVIDDNSKDNSIEILKTYKKKILVIKNKKKRSLGYINQMNAYKQGYQIAKGKIICFLDSDDYFKKNKITNVVNFFLKSKKSKFYFDLPIIISNNNLEYKKKKKKFLKNHWSYLPPTSCISVKKKSFRKIFELIYFKKFHNIWMDFRIGICAKYIYDDFNLSNKNLTFYRKTENNVSSSFGHLSVNWWKRRLEAHHYIIFFFKKNNLYFKKNFDFFLTKIINFFI